MIFALLACFVQIGIRFRGCGKSALWPHRGPERLPVLPLGRHAALLMILASEPAFAGRAIGLLVRGFAVRPGAPQDGRGQGKTPEAAAKQSQRRASNG